MSPLSPRANNPYHEDEHSGCTTHLSLNRVELDRALTLDKTTYSCHILPIKRARSSSSSLSDSGSDSSEDDILRPPTHPPIFNDLTRFVKRAKVDPTQKPYESDLTVHEHRIYQMVQMDHINLVDLEKCKTTVDSKSYFQHVPPSMAVQALVAKNADVEWRRVRALSTAWEIYAREEHLRFLHMLLEDQAGMYASAALEAPDTLIEEPPRVTEGEVKDDIAFGVTACCNNVEEYSVADAQFECLASAFHAPICMRSGNSTDDS